ncbi:C45 family peptidase [Candidatus Ulvibacter alkanivorans]|uniref:C45 family peptidase n=1 Tax=Candidatus Ulvibacter alkanivorans TaxID=2267620 RepID=UPI000DF3A392|nr:C45 family peptidase [Candidatus Ulvibacter alkanivorans]
MIKKFASFLPLLALLLSLLFVSCGINRSLKHRPDLSQYNSEEPVKTVVNDSTFFVGNSFLTKNQHGLWEMYVEGDALERGLRMGSLTEALLQKQEAVFLNKVNELVPSPSKQKFLRKFLSWYNRKLHLHITPEYQAEIYGVSRFASNEFNEIAPPYLRAMYLHGAHDIGHALQDLALVGCTSFAVWDDKSADGQLLIGRNFDFYAGDAFAEEKIIAFVNPEHGYKFMSVTWGGMIGVVSGMNEHGLTVTINAGKSKIPLVAKTPISLVTREILQYATTIDEAIDIAKRREVFVSEAIFIGSAKDDRAALIEVAPRKFGVYEVENSANQLICSNHFQSETYVNDRRNRKTIEESHTQYRFDRMEELLDNAQKIDPALAVSILRNKKGLNDKDLGYGNEKAINQLLAHHGIVFQPEERRVWISTNPYQLGEFVAYDLDDVFANRSGNPSEVSLSIPAETIAQDPFVDSDTFAQYEEYRTLERKFENALDGESHTLKTQEAEQLIALNSAYWKAYYLAGRYYYDTENYDRAVEKLSIAVQKEIPSLAELEEVEKYLRKAKRKHSNQ